MWHRLGKGGTKYWGKRGAGTILTDGKVVLLLKRGEKSDYAGHWSLPGGKVEEGETFLGGAQRETREETGQMPTVTRLASFDNQDGRFVFKSFLCRVDKPYAVKLSDEHTDSRWVPLDEINNLKLHPKLREIMPAVLRTIREKIGGTDLKESVFHTGDMMKIGPFAIWEMQKYIDKHSQPLTEGWPWSPKPPSPPPGPPPVSSLTPGKVNPQVAAFLPHIISELELPTPVKPEVMKALTSIVSRVAPEPFGTGGMLRLDWFRVICNAVYENEAAQAAAAGTEINPSSAALNIAKNPVQLLHAIRSVMPQERFHSKVTLEGGYGKNGDAHDQHFIDTSQRMQREFERRYGVNSPKTPPGGGGPGPGPGPGPGGSTITGVPADMMAVIQALPKSAWFDSGGKMLGVTELTKKINDILMLGNFTGYKADAATIPDLQKFIASIP